jgi:hypothetical protein
VEAPAQVENHCVEKAKAINIAIKEKRGQNIYKVCFAFSTPPNKICKDYMTLWGGGSILFLNFRFDETKLFDLVPEVGLEPTWEVNPARF